jgi:hypothetical protein
MQTDNFFQSKLFKGVILGIAGLIILVFVFGLGVSVGTKKADFSFRWADEYHHNFGGPQGGFFGNMMGQDFTEANGVFGQIIKIDNQTLTIKGRDNVEKNILVGDKTAIIYQRKNIKISELKLDEVVVVIGDPNNSGQIEAELIRVLPSPLKNSQNNNSISPEIIPQPQS